MRGRAGSMSHARVVAEWFDAPSIRLAKAAGFGANCAGLPARRGDAGGFERQ